MAKQSEVGLPDNHLAQALGVGLSGKTTVITAAGFSKAEQDLLRSNALAQEDDILKALTANVQTSILRPTYDPIQLCVLVQQNNTLGQCVSAMEVNVDGTGYTIERRDGAKKTAQDDKAIANIMGFFDEPYPDESFLTQRRKLRRDLESTGNGYLEVIRNRRGEIVFLSRLDAKFVRLLKLDNTATEVERTVSRNGNTVTLKIAHRERRYAQIIGTQVVYFKEFGSTRVLHKETGKWDTDKNFVKPMPGQEATEIIHFTIQHDVTTPYGVPRWVNQIPSVLGSRRAEEYNLEFFNHGGIPPAMILIQGGALTTAAREALTNYLGGKAKLKQRGVLVEAFSTSGDLNSAGNVRITVERFGAERQQDSMFEKYDDKCFERVRSAFRLPPIFLGKAEDYSHATAKTSYMVAEAQVFKPEREEFDEVINVKLMSEMFPDYLFRSVPLSVKDAEEQLNALALAKDKVETPSIVEAVNEIANLNLVAKEEVSADEMLKTLTEKITANGGSISEIEGNGEGEIQKMDDSILTELADDWARYQSGDVDFEPATIRTMEALVKSMAPQMRKLFNGYVAMRLIPPLTHDPEGVAELVACATGSSNAH